MSDPAPPPHDPTGVVAPAAPEPRDSPRPTVVSEPPVSAALPPPRPAEEDAFADQATIPSVHQASFQSVRTAPVRLEVGAVAPASTGPSGTGSRPGSSPAAAEGDVVAGRYLLRRFLGSGGMGRVFEALHLELQIAVAVKLLHRFLASDPENVERFRREALAASLLQHPNVVRVLDFGSHADTFYIVMDFVEGISLNGWLQRLVGPPALAEVRSLVRQLLEVLALAHDQGIVHRDVKPENVIVSQDDQGHLVARLTDFGLARLHGSRLATQSLTREDYVAGTPGYMSPEQCRSLRVGPASDLYAVGCVLTELLQLKPLFAGETAMDVIAQQMFVPVPALARPPGAEPVPEALERLRRALLAKQPEQRPASAREALEWLDEAFSAEGGARRPSQRIGLAATPRAGRTPAWSSPPAVLVDAGPFLEVALLRVGDGAGVDAGLITGCAALDVGLTVVEFGSEALARAELVLLDAGADVAAARDALACIREASSGAGVLVCLRAPSAADLRELIEAGAAEFARYPLEPEAITRKLRRVRAKVLRQQRPR